MSSRDLNVGEYVSGTYQRLPNRARVRTFVVVVAFIALLDVLPNSWRLFQTPKLWLSTVLNRVGLSQGEWTMFAPDPETDNGWISAELVDTRGNRWEWHSPIWAEESAWKKFYGFRHVNYYNRLPLNTNVRAWGEFADYLARTLPTEHPESLTPSEMQSPALDNRAKLSIRRISLYRNSLKFHIPVDGSLPSREAETWTTSSEFLTQREYVP